MERAICMNYGATLHVACPEHYAYAHARHAVPMGPCTECLNPTQGVFVGTAPTGLWQSSCDRAMFIGHL